MYIKNKIKYKIIFCFISLFISISYCAVKDLTFPGYHRIYYPFQTEAYSSLSLGIIISKIPEKRNTKIKTDYGNKYSVDIRLSSTLIKYKNGERIYSTN